MSPIIANAATIVSSALFIIVIKPFILGEFALCNRSKIENLGQFPKELPELFGLCDML